MAYKTKRHHIKIPLQLGDIITRLDMPGSLNERATWLIEQGIAAHPEITKKAEVNVDPALAEISQTLTTRHTKKEQFFMHGKDEGCMVEGTWYDWLCLVGNILASETVKHNYPELYMPQLANDNY